MTTEISVCPSCDTTDIKRQTSRNGGERRWKCSRCSTRFDFPRQRESKKTLSDKYGGGLAARLADMSADEILSGDADE